MLFPSTSNMKHETSYHCRCFPCTCPSLVSYCNIILSGLRGSSTSCRKATLLQISLSVDKTYAHYKNLQVLKDIHWLLINQSQNWFQEIEPDIHVSLWINTKELVCHILGGLGCHPRSSQLPCTISYSKLSAIDHFPTVPQFYGTLCLQKSY